MLPHTVTIDSKMEDNSKTLFKNGEAVLYCRKERGDNLDVNEIAMAIAVRFSFLLLLFRRLRNCFDRGFSVTKRKKEHEFA
jgi:hypothetical protein